MEENYSTQKKINYEQGQTEKIHYWQPPCSCGVELKDVISTEKVHSWKPPCSCGVELEKAIE